MTHIGRVLPWQTPRLTEKPFTVILTPRQGQVLSGICRGLTNQQIGAELYLSEDTIKTHARRLFRAMNARDRAHAAALATSGQLQIAVPADNTDWSHR